MSTLMSTYAPLPVSFTRGEGCYLFDQNDQAYLDALSGISVCNLGHVHPRVSAAIAEQANTLLHTTNIYQIAHQQQLADKLCQISGMDKVFFSNSGAEANEAAIKIARKYGNDQGIKLPKVIVTENSFHGRTMATLSATGNRKIQKGFKPLVDGFIRVPFDDIETLRITASNEKDIVAILLEPIQGEGGVNIPSDDYLQQVRQLADDNNWLMMLDEVQTGMGRTGPMFAHQQDGIQPDVMTLAKALGNGVPIGACLAKGKAADVLMPGSHGSTFGGNPLVTRAALAVLEVFEDEDVLTHAKAMSTYMRSQMDKHIASLPAIKEIRMRGLMIGIELHEMPEELVQKALERHCLLNVTAGNTIRLLPPLIIDEAGIDELVQHLQALIQSPHT